MNSERLLDPVPIRFSDRTKARVRKVARRFGLKDAEIVRRAVVKALPEWEQSGVLVIEAEEK